MQKNSVRVFGLTFFMSLTILFSAGAIILLLVPQKQQTETVSSELGQYLPDAEDNMTILAIGKEENENAALYFTLLRFDAKNAILTLTGLPTETEISIGTKTKTLNRCYQQNGAAGAVSAVRQALRVSVDRYAVLGEDSLVILADSLGGVEFQIERDMQNDRTDIRAGNQMIDGRRYRDILLFEPEFQTDLQLTEALIEQRIGTISSETARELFDKLLAVTDTSVTSYDFEIRKRALKSWAEKSGEKVKIYELTGNYNADRTAFVLEDAAVSAYRQEIFGITAG